ncbi:MAG: SelB C-terminal domain-containing protein, partial [Myxococcales bacterium]|nr:SelB C-terminal domain-containing protein [Myxococcales bacterium]
TAVSAGGLWFPRDLVEAVRARVVSRLESGPPLTVIDAKSVCSLPRRQTIALLELFDALGLTRRVGEARILAKGAPA